MKAPFFEAARDPENKRVWRLRQVLEGQANILHSNRFSSKKACQDWADRMNAAAKPKPEPKLNDKEEAALSRLDKKIFSGKASRKEIHKAFELRNKLNR